MKPSIENGHMVKFDRPVIIVGAPRSGTSLLQKIIREHTGFVSVAKESDVIWNKHTHPSLHSWEYEGVKREYITDDLVASILDDFDQHILPSRLWNYWSRTRIMSHPLSARIARRVYPIADKIMTSVRRSLPQRDRQLRLVDKSVHCAYWLDLVEAVFPDAKFVHIVRDGRTCIKSMINGWRQEERFNTYLLPSKLKISGYDGTLWNFPLPPGWRSLTSKPLNEVTAHQWVSIQETIMGSLNTPRKDGRLLQVRLEELNQNTERTLKILTDFIEVPWSDYLSTLARKLPVVNSGSLIHQELEEQIGHYSVEKVVPIIRPTLLRLGYSA